MRIKQATELAAAALEAEDLARLAQALTARKKALQSGETPTPEAFEAGEKLLRGLLALQQRVAFESARLGQLQRYVEFRK